MDPENSGLWSMVHRLAPVAGWVGGGDENQMAAGTNRATKTMERTAGDPTPPMATRDKRVCGGGTSEMRRPF